MPEEPDGNLTLIELLVHKDPEIRRLAQEIAHILIDKRDERKEIEGRVKPNWN